MTAKPQSRADSLAAPGGVTFAAPEERPPIETSSGSDFYSMVSEALAKEPGKSPVSHKSWKSSFADQANQAGPDQPAKPKPVAGSDVREKPVNQSDIADDDNSESAAKDSSGAPTNTANDVDASASNIVMALLAQPANLAVATVKLAEVPKGDLKIDPNSEGSHSDETPVTPGVGASNSAGAEAKTVTAGRLPALNLKLLESAAAEAAAAKTDEKNIADTTATTKGTAPPIEQGAATSKGQLAQTTIEQELATLGQGLDPAISPDGMGVALNKQRMKFVSEKNEIAGRTMQKLPHAPLSGDISTGLAENMDAEPDSNSSGHKNEFSWSMPMANFMNNTTVTPTVAGGKLEDISQVDPQAQVDRVARLVNQEVVTIRQSGANALAVSLKVDAHTELFLQLTNHDGQIQASICCERGSVAGMDGHWSQLQESLAKQNVQLLPLEGKGSATNSPFNSPSGNGTSSQFNQSSGNPQRQTPNLSEDLVMESVGVKPVSSRNTKTKNSGPQGWESWA